MSLEVQKQERETPQSLIRRFTRRLKESGILNHARESRFYARKPSEYAQQKAALRRIEKRAEYEYKKKMGEL